LHAASERSAASERGLAFFDGLIHAEVAQNMRQPLGTVQIVGATAHCPSLQGLLEAAARRDASGTPS